MAYPCKPGNLGYGEIQGYTPEGIPAYSNRSDGFFSGERNFDGKVFTGFKWQCVEFARRWLLERKGIMLPDIPWAAHIFTLQECELAATAEVVKVEHVDNGTESPPEANTLLIYPSMDDNIVGHVAVIVEVGEGFIRIADQNQHFHKWEGNYSQQLKVTFTDGKYLVTDPLNPDDPPPLGWVRFPGVPDRDPAEPLVFHTKYHLPTFEAPHFERVKFRPENPKSDWLDLSKPAQKKFVETFGMDVTRTRLDEQEASYYVMNWELAITLVRAGTQLHQMFINATRRVLEDDEMLTRFGIPEDFWPRIRRSFVEEMHPITGRFDFAVNGDQIKCFEYNADSASTLLECSVVQQKWAESVGIHEGSRHAGFRIAQLLVDAWKEANVQGTIYFCVDNDDEEQYTSLYVAEKAEEAGFQTKLCVMFDEFTWKDGKVVDSTGAEVRNVWKTWMWESTFTDYFAAKEARGPNWKPQDGEKVRLCDLLLRDEIRVFEPIWKVIPSNKAILPVLWEMYPDHPFLLRTEWTLTDKLRQSGYAAKPIVGRCGRNVTITGAEGEELKATTGEFENRDLIYQEYFTIPQHHGYHAILGGWMIGHAFGGTGVREDHTIVTGVDSPFAATRIRFPPSGAPQVVTHDTIRELREEQRASLGASPA